MLARNRILTHKLKHVTSNLYEPRSVLFTYRSYYQSKPVQHMIPTPSMWLAHKRGPNKPNVPKLLIGVATVAGVGISAYALLKKSKQSDKLLVEEEIENEFAIPLVNENLEEDIKLLKEFGPVPFLLIGAGSASFAAFRSIRTKDPTAKVLIIGDEPFYPYMRPPLSKELWFDPNPDVAKTLSFLRWNGKERSVFYEPQDYYFSIKELLENKNGGVSVIRGKKVVKIDPISQVVYLDSGEEISYEKCLVATGARPKNLPIFEKTSADIKKHVTLFRSVQDFQKLDKISKTFKSVAIVGGGFLGSELACGLAKRGTSTGLSVTQIFPESGNMGKVLPEYLSKWTTKKLQNEGVRVISDMSIKGVNKEDKKIKLHLSNDEVISVDHVVVAVGAEANTDIAITSGLEIDEKHGGFLVNAELEARKNLWVAGDASCFYDIKLGRRRVEHHDHAVVSGRLAGENMTGSGKPYWHQSMFWSDLGPDIGYEAIGIVDSTLPTVGVFAKATPIDTPKSVVEATGESIRSETEAKAVASPASIDGQIPRAPESADEYGKGIIFYLRDNIIVGILLWNVFAKMSIARKIINESKSYDDLAEVAKLFELHSSEDI